MLLNVQVVSYALLCDFRDVFKRLFSVDTFKCVSNDKCIDRDFVCDGVPHCLDASDESKEPDGPCGGTCALKSNFKCDGNRCIKR